MLLYSLKQPLEYPSNKPMNSAYFSALGSEPAFTSYGGRDHPIFSGTLDYIFVSSDWTVSNVSKLPSSIQELSGPLPTMNEPSDHLMISAVLKAKEISKDR